MNPMKVARQDLIIAKNVARNMMDLAPCGLLFICLVPKVVSANRFKEKKRNTTAKSAKKSLIMKKRVKILSA